MIFIYPGFGKSATSTLTAVFDKHSQVTLLEHRNQSADGRPKKDCMVLASEAYTNNPYTRDLLAHRLSVALPDASVIFTIRHQFDALKSFYANHGRLIKSSKDVRHISFKRWLSFALKTRELSFVGTIDYYRTVQMYEERFKNIHSEMVVKPSLEVLDKNPCK